MKTRKLVKIYTPQPQQGFLGPDHTARAVIQVPYPESDPFIMLMDDILDKKDEEPAGGPHPHAGFETVSLLLEGELGDGVHTMKSGDFQIMTAGRGVIHTETLDKKVKMRMLQLWLALPKQDRWAQPRIQDISVGHVPERSGKGVNIRVYSGTWAGLSSPILNHVPMIVADIQMNSDTRLSEYLPSSYTAFLYVIAGSIHVGDKVLRQNQVGWLDRDAEAGESAVTLQAGSGSAHVILYAGQPQGDEIVSHGPFIADTKEDIQRLYREYRQGEMSHITEVEESQKLVW